MFNAGENQSNEPYLGDLGRLRWLLALDLDLPLVGDLGDGPPLRLALIFLNHLDGLQERAEPSLHNPTPPRRRRTRRLPSKLDSLVQTKARSLWFYN